MTRTSNKVTHSNREPVPALRPPQIYHQATRKDRREEASTTNILLVLPQVLGEMILALNQYLALPVLSFYTFWVSILMGIAIGSAQLPINPGTNLKNVFVSKEAFKTS